MESKNTCRLRQGESFREPQKWQYSFWFTCMHYVLSYHAYHNSFFIIVYVYSYKVSETYLHTIVIVWNKIFLSVLRMYNMKKAVFMASAATSQLGCSSEVSF